MILKKIAKYLFNLLLLSLIVFLYAFSNSKNALKKIQKIDVQFTSQEPYFLSQSMVNKLLTQNGEKLLSRAKYAIDLYELEQKLLENPYVEKASLYVTYDGILHSLIKPRQPIARILDDTTSYYIDSQMLKIPLSENNSARVPLITGAVHENSLLEVTTLLNKIAVDSFMDQEIIGIHLLPTNECFLTVRSGHYKIEFGKLTELDFKIKKIKALYSQLFLDSTIHKYKVINIKYRNQVIGVNK